MTKRILFNCILCLLPAIVGIVARVVVYNSILIDGKKIHNMSAEISELEIENKKLKLRNAQISSYRELSTRAVELGMIPTSISFIENKDSTVASNINQ